MQLPETVTWENQEYTLYTYVNDEGNYAVEYVNPDHIFPVAFVNETHEEAKGYMISWLQDNGLM